MSKPAAIALIVMLCATGALAQSRVAIVGRGGAPSSVQRRGGEFAIPDSRRGLIGLTGASQQDRTRHRRFDRNTFLYGGLPYWPSEDMDSYEPQQPAQVPPAPSPQVKPQPTLAPVLYELRDNRWVRVNFGEPPAPPNSPGSQPFVPPVAKELPPAILVYRDGHTEELSSYSIIGVMIYTKADYWTSGGWTRKIQIADLDLPATLKQNHERGLAFQLPSGPNEVILRP